MSLEINQMLTLSTAHISEEDVEWLILQSKYVYPYEEGWFVPIHIADLLDGQDSLAACITLAEHHNCTMLRLDRDGPTINSLPTYSW